MVGYFVPFDSVELTITSTSVDSATMLHGSYDIEPPPAPGAGFEALACREAREAPRSVPIRSPSSARGGDTRYHELRPP